MVVDFVVVVVVVAGSINNNERTKERNNERKGGVRTDAGGRWVRCALSRARRSLSRTSLARSLARSARPARCLFCYLERVRHSVLVLAPQPAETREAIADTALKVAQPALGAVVHVGRLLVNERELQITVRTVPHAF